MHMKYFQSLANIARHYEEHFEHKAFYEKEGWEFNRLATKQHLWGVDEDVLIKERDAMRYLVHLQHMLAYGSDYDLVKPSVELVNNALDRHLAWLDLIFKCNADTYKTCPHKSVMKEYLACRHYKFKFSLQGWYDRLPEVIQTFESKYGYNPREGRK